MHSDFSLKSKYGKIILVHVYIKFALPDYSGEVIERLQNLIYGRLIHLALEFCCLLAQK